VSDPGAETALDAVQEALGYRFVDPTLARHALTHSSFAHESGDEPSNERLEFLGDAVLGLAIAQLLYEGRPEWQEGDLTRARAALVNRHALADCARQLGVGGWVKLGRTEQRSAGEEKDSILANCLEALIGAVYLDGGLEPARGLVRRVFGDAILRGAARDPKTEFQEWAHAHRSTTPSYHTAADSGTENDDERFTVEVRVAGEVWGTGRGRSKRVAERAAASAALERAEPGEV
jgi:ribonuclease-3